MKPPVLRSATAADVPELARIIAAAFEVYRGALTPPSSSLDKSPEAVRRELETAAAVVAVQGETLSGCVFYEPRGDHVYLSRLAVLPEHPLPEHLLPEHKGKETARALLLAVEDETLHLNIDKLRLQVRLVQKRNRALYEALGYAFYSYGTHAGCAEPTFVTLEKRLGQDRQV